MNTAGSAFLGLPAWAAIASLLLCGLLAGTVVGYALAAWQSRKTLARQQSDWQQQSERERALWQAQQALLRADLQQLQTQAMQWREALDSARDERAQWQERAQRIAPLEAQLAAQQAATLAAQEALARLQSEHAALSVLHEEQSQQASERLQFLEKAREDLRIQFQHLAQTILEEKAQRFTAHNQQQLGELLAPLRERLQSFQGRIEQFYDAEGKQRAALSQQVQDLLGMNQRLAREAQQLAQALKGSTKTQGNWGEAVLERILEQAGLRAGHDYQTQVSYATDGGRSQPDVVLHLPQNRHIVIDAKVSLTAYTRYVALSSDGAGGATMDAEIAALDNDEAARARERRLALRQHVDSLRTHIRQLGERNYHQLHGLQSLDFVILFVPIEPAFLLALAEDERLAQQAWERNVLLVSPTTLLFVLRTIAHLWRQEAQTRNAQEIARRGAELYDKLVAFVETLEKLGQQLGAAQSSWQQAMHRLAGQRGNVIRQAEQLKALGIQPGKAMPAATLERDETADEPAQAADHAALPGPSAEETSAQATDASAHKPTSAAS
ncbi:DNA recombination protein RmuC [Lampropedia cohaerens]|uniref:DNA recombination protein RmuC n=1 Tax=Lampropedia cohaerens TaxID=1610491 RepID=UPI000A07C423|nr:DNA recombination protein RmuC [Lampropedia cohaerens]